MRLHIEQPLARFAGEGTEHGELLILQLVVVRHMTAHCIYSKSAAGARLQVERLECRQTALRKRPLAHQLWRLQPHHIDNPRTPHVADGPSGAAINLYVISYNGNFMMPN